MRLYDLESEPADSGDTSSESDSQACKQSEATHRGHEASSCVDNNNSRSTISCNSSPLVRESVRGKRNLCSVTVNSTPSPPSFSLHGGEEIQIEMLCCVFVSAGPGDYVYDLYYTQSCSLQDMMTW